MQRAEGDVVGGSVAPCAIQTLIDYVILMASIIVRCNDTGLFGSLSFCSILINHSL